MTIREDVKRALDQRLQDIRSIHWGRGFQLANENDRDKCIETVLSLIEPALEAANMEIVHKPIIPGAHAWQYDRNVSEKDTYIAKRASQVDSRNDTNGQGELFYNGLC